MDPARVTLAALFFIVLVLLGAPSVAAQANRHFLVQSNKGNYQPGDQAVALLSGEDPAGFFPRDLYVGLLFPDGDSLIFITPQGLLPGRLSDPHSFRANATGSASAAGIIISSNPTPIAQYRWGGGEPVGTYSFFIAATFPGAFNDGSLDPEDIDFLETTSFTFSLNADLCSPWPVDVCAQLSRLTVVNGLTFVRAPGPGLSFYEVEERRVVFVSPAPFGGEIASIAHEICHAHQHRAVEDEGGALLAGSLLEEWARTEEGQDFIATTGWRKEGSSWVAPAWEPGWSGYPNPLEDCAQLCATYYDPSRVYGYDYLEKYAPLRYAWARRWFLK